MGFLLLRDLSQGSCPQRSAGGLQPWWKHFFFCAIRAFAGRNTHLCGEPQPSGDVLDVLDKPSGDVLDEASRDVLDVLVELSSAGMSQAASILSICHILL